MTTKRFKNSQGKCPNCDSEDLSYHGVLHNCANQCYEEFECNNCFHEGKEWFSLTYIDTELDQH